MKLQNVIQGVGSLKELPLILRNDNHSRVLLITGGESFGSIIEAAVYEKLFEGRVVHRLKGFHFSPKSEDVVLAVKETKDFKPTVIVSIGGGTVIDIAKLVNAFYTIGCDIKPYIQGEIALDSTSLPHIAIPTTSGTGSEATHFAVAYVDGKKYSVAHEAMLPNHVILDPSLTYSLPSFQTAATGMDALCQGIESYWSVNSTEESRQFARKAIEFSTEFLLQAYSEPNPKNREGMQLAAFYSGKAINISKTTAAHAFSYHLTSKYGIPHGQAVGLLIGWVFQENLKVLDNNCNDPRGAVFVRERLVEIKQILKIERDEDITLYFQKMNKRLGLQSERFSLTKETIKELMQVVNQERLGNNPVRIVDVKKDFEETKSQEYVKFRLNTGDETSLRIFLEYIDEKCIKNYECTHSWENIGADFLKYTSISKMDNFIFNEISLKKNLFLPYLKESEAYFNKIIFEKDEEKNFTASIIEILQSVPDIIGEFHCDASMKARLLRKDYLTKKCSNQYSRKILSDYFDHLLDCELRP